MLRRQPPSLPWKVTVLRAVLLRLLERLTDKDWIDEGSFMLNLPVYPRVVRSGHPVRPSDHSPVRHNEARSILWHADSLWALMSVMLGSGGPERCLARMFTIVNTASLPDYRRIPSERWECCATGVILGFRQLFTVSSPPYRIIGTFGQHLSGK